LLTGGAGVDTFVTTADAGGNAAFGNDTVTDFNVAQDVVSLRAFPTIRSFADVQSLLTQDGADAVITVSTGNSVRLQNVNVASLTANNFLLLNLNIIGTDASETLTGDVGDDNIQGRGGNDTLFGLDGNDTLDGGSGIDTLNGGPGNDTLLDPDTLGIGTTMIGGAGNDAITGGTPDYATDPAAIIANLSTVPFDVNGNGSLIVAPRTVLDGYAGTDTLAGTISNFEASYFDDTVVGGAGNEQFFLFAGNDRASGGDGSDAFQGGSGDDFIDGGAGTDSLNYTDLAEDGGPAAANQGIRLNLSNVAVDIGGGVILGPNGGTDNYGNHDTVFNIEIVNGSRFGDVIVGNATTLQLIGGDGNDTLLGGSGNEALSGGAGNDLIDGGAGTDSVSFGGPSGAIVNLLTQTASDGQGGADVVRNVETVFGTSFADELTGDDNNNSLFGSGGIDVLHGNGGADSLDGSDGNDTLVGGDGNDQLNGGRNDDLLTGGNGQDTFTFVRTTQPPIAQDFGADVITDFSVATDVLNLAQVPELTSLTAVLNRATQNAQGVLLQVNAQNSIQLNGLTLADLPLMSIVFAPIVATAGDDTLDGTEAGNFIDGLAGNDTINGLGGNDTLFGSDGNDVLNGGDGVDSLNGGNGNDTLNGDAGDDFLDSGGGNDTLTGGAGGDSFRPTSGLGGVGLDVITDFSSSDRLDLTGIASMTSREALSAAATQVGAHVVITVDPTSSITIRNLTLAQLDTATVFFAPFNGTPGNDVLNGLSGSETINGLGGDDVINGNGGNDNVSGGDGNDTLNGGQGNDTLFGDAGSDALDGGDGNDGLIGGNGNDTLVGGADFDSLDGGAGDDTSTGGTDGADFFRASLGHDVITDLTAGSDQLDLSVFQSLTSQEALAAVASEVGPDVVITIDADSSLTLRNFTVAQLLQTSINFAPLTGTQGNDVLNGSSGGETMSGFGGDDLLNGNGGNDSIFGGDGDDTLNGGQGNDSLSGDAGTDTLDGGDGFDGLFGGSGNDTLVGGADFDNFDGGAGDDTSTGGTDTGDFFRASLGHDVITDLTPGSDLLDLGVFPSLTSHEALAAVANEVGADVVITIDASNSLTLRNFSLAQLLQTSITFAPLNGTGGNDVLSGSDGSETISGLGGDDTINGNGGSDTVFGGAGNDTLDGGDGADLLVGDAGNDTLTGGADNDQLDGGAGDDTLTGGGATDFFRMNLGHDVITDFSVAEDQLDLGQIPALTGRDALQAASSQQGADVLITIDADNSITIRDLTLAQLASAAVAFAPINGTTGNDVLNGTSSDDAMNGFAGDDVLNGLGGNDVVNGQEGADTLSGGDGNDLLVGSVGDDTLDGGDGTDTLEGGSGNDTMTSGAGADYFRGLEEEGNDVITDFTEEDRLELGSVPSMVSRAALLAASAQVGADVVITIDADSTLTLRNFTLAQLATANVTFASFAGTEGNDVLEGTDEGEQINGLGGDDVISGNGGSDNLFGGEGSDTLNGGADGDVLNGGNGNDTLSGGDGSDYMQGESGNDTLIGGLDSDQLVGGAGDDVMTGGAGNDTFLADGGHDTITDFDAETDSLDLRTVPSMSRPSALAAAALQVGNDVVVNVDANNSITLQNLTLAQLSTASVFFAPIIGTDAGETIDGSESYDTIYGRGGDDVLNGGENNDSLFGESGNDTLNGDSGFDFLNGGLGNDTLNGGSSIDVAELSFNEQTHGVVADLLTMTALDDGAGGMDNLIGIENLWGSVYDDTLTGDGNDNSLFGSAGNDVLRGIDGNDSLQGSDGDDTLRGDGGNDLLYGDAGDDLFVFAAGDGADSIQDFAAGAGSDDVIDLQALPGFDTFADVQAAITDDGFGNSVIDLGGGNQITLIGVTESALHADDFLL
jgi:Ca2+-binding RTX toxin-like protein